MLLLLYTQQCTQHHTVHLVVGLENTSRSSTSTLKCCEQLSLHEGSVLLAQHRQSTAIQGWCVSVNMQAPVFVIGRGNGGYAFVPTHYSYTIPQHPILTCTSGK